MDVQARTKALDTNNSFIVQAPAGSGKTELLTQRFLALLPTVAEPEQIVALTFTKKAALEMAHRILQALRDAKNQTPLKNEHQRITRQLAEEALSHAEQLNWQILDHPQRLKIKTFDSFCMEIYKAIPKEEFATLAELQTDPKSIYQKAVQNWFEFCRADEVYHNDLKCLIRQVNNQLSTLLNQLRDLLYKRDQWLPAIQNNKTKSLDEHLSALRDLSLKHWEGWQNSLSTQATLDLMALIKDYHDYVPDGFEVLKNLENLEHLTSAQFRALKAMLMTGQGTPRKAFDYHIGVYKNAKDKRYAMLKEKSTTFLSELEHYPEFIEHLNTLIDIPHPQEIEIDWETLQSYYRLLPLLAAHLHLVFEEQESMDYIYVAQQAIFALQHSDVSLYFDNHLHHLLIDEFQDTSWVQLELIQQLIQEWSSEEHKTMFVVGDPMQSIYRFRSADVGIFLNTCQQGLGPLQLTPLQLTQNFRSNSHLIEHFNAYFAEIFPKTELIDLGGVRFHPAQPVIPGANDCFVQANYYETSEAQTQAIVDILHEAKNKKNTRVAILVRTRSKLPEILQTLESLQFQYAGVDLFPLGERLYIRDLWNLTKVFLEPGHRVYELAVLRSPLCGLTLEELETIAELSPKTSLFEYLSSNPGAHARLQYFMDIFQKAWRKRHQVPLVELIQEMAHQLSFLKSLTPYELEEVMLFLGIIEQMCAKYTWPSVQEITDKLSKTFVSSSGGLELQVMTIHKSKGLEFDWVILPDMGSKTQKSEKTMLKWLQTQNSLDYLILPDKNHPNLKLLEWYEKKQEHHELQRLCYVAFTRAKQRLYCFDAQKQASKGSLRTLFPKDYFQEGQLSSQKTQNSQKKIMHKRIAEKDYIQPQHLIFEKRFHVGEGYQNHAQQKLMGTIAHRILQWICQYHPQEHQDIPWGIAMQYFKAHGLSKFESEQGLIRIKELVLRFLKHPIGAWICEKRNFEKNEFPLLIQDGEIIRHMVLDRIFIENNRLWIIDFKTKKDNDQYRIQLNRYAQALSQLYPDYSMTCGLFFLSTQEWKTWEPSLAAEAMLE
jgi:ATP-dependent helicase/nuclease subunit A